MFVFFFSSRRRHTRLQGDWSSDVCSSDLSSPIWSCSAWGFPCRQNYSCRGALLPHHFTLTPPCGEAVYFLWHFPSSPCEPARPLAGTLPCGDRTFLPRGPKGTGSDCPSGSLTRLFSHFLKFFEGIVYWKHPLPGTKTPDLC